MDLVKARERARQKALQEKKEAERELREAGAPGPGQDAPPEGPKPVRTAEPGPVQTREDKPGRKRKKKDPGPAPEKTPAAPDPAEEAEVFSDDAFGEDLPAMDLDEELPQDAVLGESGPEVRFDDGGMSADEEDISWEVKKVPAIPKAPAPTVPPVAPPARDLSPGPASAAGSADKKPVPPGPPPLPAEPEVKECEPAPARAGAPAAPYGLEPAPSAGRAEVMVDWEEAEPSWSFDSPSGSDDDFYALVTEDLYMREFGRQDEDQGRQLELLSFRLAREVYAVRLTSIKQIIKLQPITTVPRAPDYVLGVLSLRGTVVPVFDLRRRLRLPRSEPTRKSRIVVVAEGARVVGLIVDEVQQVVRISSAGIEPPPSVLAGVEADYIEGIGRAHDQMIIVLALDKILTPVAAADKASRLGG